MKRKKEYLWIIGIIIVLLLMISLAVFKTKSNYQGNESLVYSYNGWLYYNNEFCPLCELKVKSLLNFFLINSSFSKLIYI